jgi:redox-sensitive bicupin YhaK (pirin superfamily)
MYVLHVHAPTPVIQRAPTQRARLLIAPEQFEAHSPFLLMAEDWFAPPAGFPTHPHRGMETVTLVLEGEVQHADHTGAKGTLTAGDVQFMTAGHGVMHSKLPGPGGVHLLQLWLNLPARLKHVSARYADLRAGNVPVHSAPGVQARVYAGRWGDAAQPHGSTWPLSLFDLTIAAGTDIEVPVPTGERTFVVVLSGAVTLAGTDMVAPLVAWLDNGPPPVPSPGTSAQSPLMLHAAETSRVLVYASPVIDEPVVAHGPFVMNTRAEIEEAYADLRSGRLTG